MISSVWICGPGPGRYFLLIDNHDNADVYVSNFVNCASSVLLKRLGFFDLGSERCQVQGIGEFLQPAGSKIVSHAVQQGTGQGGHCLRRQP